MKNLPRTPTTNLVNAHFTSLHLASKRRLGFCALLALRLAAGPAAVRADTIYEQGELPALLPGFNPTNGQLVEVDISANVTLGFTMYVGNSSDYPCAYYLTGLVPCEITIQGIGNVCGCLLGFGASGNLPPYSSVECSGTGLGSASTSDTQAADLAVFTGNNYVGIYGGCDPAPMTWSVSPSPPMYCSVPTCSFEGGEVSLTYDYEPLTVPEPSTLGLLAVGMLGITLLRRHQS